MRMLHTMIRVGDLDRSIAFYTEILGMKLLRRKDYPDGKFTLAFVGYGDESETAVPAWRKSSAARSRRMSASTSRSIPSGTTAPGS